MAQLAPETRAAYGSRLFAAWSRIPAEPSMSRAYFTRPLFMR